jgi:dihydroorotate dehydrogenase
MWPFFRLLFFRLDPETAHHLTLKLIRLGAYQPFKTLLQAMYTTPAKPVGLAAGYDKDGLAWRGLATLGFGHIEVGTVTPLPQPGNPRPRLFRLVEDRALINRLGFPGMGADAVAARVIQKPGLGGMPGLKDSQVILGVNLGKNKDTPLENAASDYLALLRQFTPLADYLAINVSSPNTAGLRRLQGRDMLESLLGAVAKERASIASGSGQRPPILVKLAPDLSDEELDDALDVILCTGMDGVIATNTTLGRAGLHSSRSGETGGLSGEPLRVRSEAVLRYVVRRLDGRLPVVSAGGIMKPEHARARLDAGAILVQVYTGLVYAGPGLVKQILRNI